jgi:hypothetical protein
VPGRLLIVAGVLDVKFASSTLQRQPASGNIFEIQFQFGLIPYKDNIAISEQTTGQHVDDPSKQTLTAKAPDDQQCRALWNLLPLVKEFRLAVIGTTKMMGIPPGDPVGHRDPSMQSNNCGNQHPSEIKTNNPGNHGPRFSLAHVGY